MGCTGQKLQDAEVTEMISKLFQHLPRNNPITEYIALIGQMAVTHWMTAMIHHFIVLSTLNEFSLYPIVKMKSHRLKRDS